MDRKPRSGKTKAAPAKNRGPKMRGARSDFGAPIDAFFEKQPAHLRAILEALRAMVQESAPDAEASLKWGMPWFMVGGKMMCSLGGHKTHVNLVLIGPPHAFEDPNGLLSGSGANGRHLRLTSLDDLPRAAVRRWLRTAVALARKR